MQYLILFLEGIITFISPCLLPMLPVYVSYFAAGKTDKRRTFVNALGFVAGFTLVFIVLGAFAGTAGHLLAKYSVVVNIVTGLVVIILGLNFLGIRASCKTSVLQEQPLKIACFAARRARNCIASAKLTEFCKRLIINKVSGIRKIWKTCSDSPNFHIKKNIRFFNRSGGTANVRDLHFCSSMLFGMVFSIGWTPCVSAFLGSALMLASNRGGTFNGIVMLLVYSLGLGIPFMMSAILIDRLKSAFDFIKRNYRIINIISGILLIVTGIIMTTGLMGRFLSLNTAFNVFIL